MRCFVGLVVLLFTLSSCQNTAVQNNTNQEEEVIVESINNGTPSMPREELIALYNAADDIDIQFLEKSFSMNAPAALAKNSISYISDQGREKTPCTEICYLFVKSQGNQIAHIGAFLDNDCAYYVFYEDGRPKYVNAMTQGGLDFFKRILAQVNTSKQ